MSQDKPVTKKDISDLLITLSTQPGSPQWLKAQDYRRKIGLGITQFQKLKSLGKFDGGTDPATFGTRHIRIHEWWSYSLQCFIVPSTMRNSNPNKRGKNGKVQKSASGSSKSGASEHITEKQPQRCPGNEGGKYMP